MTLHSLAGVFLTDLTLVAIGAAILWGTGIAPTGRSALRLAGLAWLVGAAALGTLLTLELMTPLPFSLATVLVDAAVLVAAGCVLAVRRRSASVATFVARGPVVVSGAGVAIAVLLLESQFRAGRLAGLFEWDAMSFWVPKAKAIYYFGHLDPAFMSTLANAWYPPLVPALDATAFTFMGSTDAVTLHLVYWSALVAFVAAVAGLLAPYVNAAILWPVLLMLAAAPVITDHGVSPLADLLLDYFLALSAILVVQWIRGADVWFLAIASGFLGAAAMTKREGLLLAICVVAALTVAVRPRTFRAWSAVGALAAPAVLLTLAWHVWLSDHHIGAPGPETGYFGFVHELGRVGPSLHLTLHVLFSATWWKLTPFVVIAGVLIALLARVGKPAVFAAAYAVFSVLGCTWVLVSLPTVPLTTDGALNPIVRLSGGVVLPAAAVLPLLLEYAWHARPNNLEEPL